MNNNIQQIECYTFEFTNLGFLGTQFDESQLKPIRDEVNGIYKNNFNDSVNFNSELAGNIEHQYMLTKCVPYLNDLLTPLIKKYNEETSYVDFMNKSSHQTESNLVLDKVWAIFQKKHEFNPPHVHWGVISFVLWLDIPYDIKDEMSASSSCNSAINIPGHFQFLYNDAIGRIATCNIPTDKTYCGKVLIFPSSMTHAVYPFKTSDGIRISVSGNLKWNTNSNSPKNDNKNNGIKEQIEKSVYKYYD